MNYKELVKAQDDKLEETIKINIKIDEESKKIETLKKKSDKAYDKFEELNIDKKKIEKKITNLIKINNFCFISCWIFNIIGFITFNPILHIIAMAFISENFLSIPIRKKLIEKRKEKEDLLNTCKALLKDYDEDIQYHCNALISCQEQIDKQASELMDIMSDVYDEEVNIYYNNDENKIN